MWIGKLGVLVRDQPKAVNVHMYSKRMTKSKRVSSVRELKERKESLQVENANPWTCFSRPRWGGTGQKCETALFPPVESFPASSFVVSLLSLCLYITDRL